MLAEKSPPPSLPLRRPPGYKDPNAELIHHQPKKRRAWCRICCCFFCSLIVILILAAISASLTLYIWFQPRLPQIHLKSIVFTKLNLSTSAEGAAQVDAASTVAVEIKNPNQNLGLFYESIHVSLSAVNGDVSLGEQTVGGFSQDRGSATTIKVAIKVEREIVDGKCAEELNNGLRSKDLVMNGEIRSGIGIKQRRWASAPVGVEILCDGVRLREVQGGGGAFMHKCRIKVFNWYVCLSGSCY